MNWEAMGAVGDLVGGIGVIVTLGYLALQIRQNSAQLAAQSRSNYFQTRVAMMLGYTDSELADVVVKRRSGGSLTDSEEFPSPAAGACDSRRLGVRGWRGIGGSAQHRGVQPSRETRGGDLW